MENDVRSDGLKKSVWAGLILLGLAGQLAWAVENQFFNTFMYNRITPDPRPISWMVSATALVATLASILMGTFSDRTRSRWGRRRPYLVLGYLAWGVFTALYPTSARFQPVGVAIGMAILFDCLMTFCGSTANDAAFNAYVTDVTTTVNRGRVTGVLQIMTWVAILIVYGGAPMLIEVWGYEAFFYLIGALVMVVGLASGWLLKEEGDLPPVRESYGTQLASTFRWKTLRKNRNLFLVLLAVTFFTTAQNIFFPYLLIYLQHYIQLETLQYSVLVAAAILIGGIAMAYPFGLLVDRWGRLPVGLLAVVGEATGLVLFSLSRSFVWLTVTGILWLAPISAWTIATMTWTKDLFPDDKRGQFAGIYVLFYVLFPQILGSLLGGWLGARFGIPIVLEGQAGFVPTPLIFQVAGVATLLAALPLLVIRREARKATNG